MKTKEKEVKQKKAPKTVSAYGFRIDAGVYNTMMEIAGAADRDFPYLAKIAFKEFASKYKGKNINIPGVLT